MIPNILSIAGSDPSGGACIQADIKSISANGGYGMAAITALTAQNTQKVAAVDLVSPDMVTSQITVLRDDIRIDAVKIGMLGSAAIVEAVGSALEGLDVPVVLDTVMVAKSGDRLLARDAVNALRDILLPRATVITPNLPEAADFLGVEAASNAAEMEQHATALTALGARAVFLKGGHLSDTDSPDLLIDSDVRTWMKGQRQATANTHGTGCTLSSALATHLGAGRTLADAARTAKAYVAAAITGSGQLCVGGGHGPTHHFHALWAGTRRDADH